ncbi:MAG: exodeoxyribonuclease VII small subunit [Gemmataceae bacterium]|nr:exodeoxyribonuclease VII small subunit [Gemmataceae bacterium]MCS7271582.1 exodeoxyribonuclease VII small subunit [Gemmataceae bacterium]MDW8242803.1 exodeoxyribonuclease VII small subunit [Thermogemmata sp.]
MTNPTPPADADKRPSPATLRFEQALEELDAIVRRLEQGQTELEQMLQDYERGMALVQRCQELLEQAEWKVQQLTGIDAQGAPVLQPFLHASRLSQVHTKLRQENTPHQVDATLDSPQTEPDQ